MEQILPLQQASQVVQASIVKGECYISCDIWGNCEKKNYRLGGHVKGKYTADGTVTWETKIFKPLPQAFIGVKHARNSKAK
jgi:hypothetical protein